MESTLWVLNRQTYAVVSPMPCKMIVPASRPNRTDCLPVPLMLSLPVLARSLHNSPPCAGTFFWKWRSRRDARSHEPWRTAMTRMQGFETTLPLWNNARKSRGLWSKLRIACALTLVCVVWASAAGAQTLNTLFTFDGTDGAFPAAPLLQGTDGNFYGTTLSGGSLGHGTVFTMTPGGQVTTLYNFCAPP